MPQQLTDVLGVAGPDLQQVAVVARDVMELQHLWTLRERPRDAIVAGRLFALDRHERQHRLIDGMGVDEGGVTPDDPSAFEFPNPFEDGGRGQSDGAGDFRLRYPSVILKKLDYLGVYFVDHSE